MLSLCRLCHRPLLYFSLIRNGPPPMSTLVPACKGINHFKAVCRSKVRAKTAQSPHRSKRSHQQRHGSMGSYNGQGKGGGNRQHQNKKTPKKPPKQKAYAVMIKNSVPSGVTTTSGGEREKQGNVSSKTVLSGPEEEGTYNRFSCFAVHSKMSQSTNTKSKPLEGLYTDTDPDDRSEIITDVTIRMPGKAGTIPLFCSHSYYTFLCGNNNVVNPQHQRPQEQSAKWNKCEIFPESRPCKDV